MTPRKVLERLRGGIKGIIKEKGWKEVFHAEKEAADEQMIISIISIYHRRNK